MSELLPCPFCGEYPILIHFALTEQIVCKCGARLSKEKPYREGEYAAHDSTCDAAITTWNRRAQPNNEPITLEELRGMVGSPVWVTHSDGSGGRWGIVNSYNHGLCADVGSGMAYWFDDYIGNVAYRRKPEGGEG